MPELLIELLSEEIPARMQARAAEDLKKLVVDGLAAAGLSAGQARAFATPRRLTLVVDGLPAKSADVRDERKGPRVGAPDPAVQGFLKSAGLKSLDEARLVSDPKKGDYYVVETVKPGRKTTEILADLVPDSVQHFSWPKSMRWGAGATRWVRPLQGIVCLFDGKPVRLAVDGVAAGRTTRGHRFMGSASEFDVEDFEDYRRKLLAEHVMLEPADRADAIRRGAKALAAEHDLELVEDESLVVENAGLVEWPVVLMGSFDEAFLAVPAEVLSTAMKAQQKCFSLRHPRGKKLAARFLLVANLKAKDGGKQIVAGNEKVIRARLSDAKFFWEQDKKKKLEPMHFELKTVTFHDKLGSQWERMERVTELARAIAGAVDAEPELAGRAAQLCKADLVSGVVGEFPELQGIMGRYYAEAEHMNPKIATAIGEHYKPQGPSDTVPKEPVAIAVALADKLDTLVGFWAIGDKPTGSKDPYALRRAALGVIRIVLENDLRVTLVEVLERARSLVTKSIDDIALAKKRAVGGDYAHMTVDERARFGARDVASTTVDLLAFFADRLKVHLKDKGARHDLIDAVFGLGNQDDLALIVRRVEALGAFLATDDGRTLLAGVKRAQNILKIEEKKDKTTHDGATDAELLREPEEKALHAAIAKSKADVEKALAVESFEGAMRALAELRAPVDAFFDKVTVNTDESKLRQNRLRLLSEIRATTHLVADFGRIEG